MLKHILVMKEKSKTKEGEKMGTSCCQTITNLQINLTITIISMPSRKKRTVKAGRPRGDAAIITADFLLTALLPILSTLIAGVSVQLT